MANKKVLTWSEMRALVKDKQAIFVEYVGLQGRPVYNVGGVEYEESIRFDWSGDYEPRFYERSITNEPNREGQNLD